MSTKEQVVAMASGIKTSAVELFKGLESSLQNREQFELALARLFSSCTGDFQASEHDIPRRNSTLSHEEKNGTTERNTLGAAPLQHEGSSNASSSRRPKSSSRNSSSRHSKKHNEASRNKNSNNARSSVSPSHRERRQTRTDYGEHIYAQLFMDDQKRAAHAVSALRETAGGRAPPAAASTPNAPSSLFPASSPSRSTKITPLSSDDLHIPETLTFDDAISAISQHTLEAMEERIKQVKSTDSSLWSSLKETKTTTPPLAPHHSHRHGALSPPTLPRVRSTQSNAASSRRSRTSHTTYTTDSSDFQKVWQQDEQKFWCTQVEQDSRKSRKSRNSSAQKTVDHTLPTLESSMDDVWASPLRPDVGPLARDPDRIGAVFVVPSTDMAEI